MKKNRIVLFLSFVCLLTILMSGCNPGTPQAAFSADVTSGTAPLTVAFTDESTIEKSFTSQLLKVQMDVVGLSGSKAQTITGWAWDFGDGDAATDQNPSHTYDAAGTYTVALTVTTSSGKTATETKDGLIVVTGDGNEGEVEGEVEEGEVEGEEEEGEGETAEGESEGETEEGESEGEIAEGEGEVAEGEGEVAEGEVAVWGDGDNWQEEVVDQDIVDSIEPETQVNDFLTLHPIPETEEFEASLQLSNFVAGVDGALYFSEFPSARANPDAKTWHMVTGQYQVRLEADEKSVGKELQPEDARLIMVVGSQDQIPEGFERVADMYVWRAFPGRAVNESGEDIDNVKAWMNLTNGHSDYVWVNDAKGNKDIDSSVNFGVALQINAMVFGSLFDSLNYGLISQKSNSDPVPQWRQDLNNNPDTADWADPPAECPDQAPEGYSYEYQGRTVVVDNVTQDCTLPGLSDPDNPTDYNDEPTDVTLIHSSTDVDGMVVQNDTIVTHTWKLVPNN